MYEWARTGEKMNQNKHELFSTDLIFQKKLLHHDHVDQGRINQDTTRSINQDTTRSLQRQWAILVENIYLCHVPFIDELY